MSKIYVGNLPYTFTDNDMAQAFAAFGAVHSAKIVTDRGPMDVEIVVLAAGVWSRPLAGQLGTSVPLEAERGYHVMFAGQDFGLRRALVSADRSVSLAHMHEGIRATGVAEFAAPDCACRHAHR